MIFIICYQNGFSHNINNKLDIGNQEYFLNSLSNGIYLFEYLSSSGRKVNKINIFR